MLGGLDYRSITAAVSRALAILRIGTAQIDSAGSLSSTLVGGYIEWSVSGNALTVSVKADSGNDPSASEPVAYAVRDATVTNGKLVPRTITSALSVTVPDTALLGTINDAPFHLWAVVFDDAGTNRLGVINCATIAANAGSGYNVTGIYPLAGWGIASSTAVGTGSDSSATFYTGSAVTSKGYVVAGYASWESGLAAAGTWSAAPTKEQAWAPGVPLPGQRVGFACAIKTTHASGNAGAVPEDDSIPQSGEGNQLMDTATITPSSAANMLRVWHQATYGHDGGVGSQTACSLFRDSTANALACAFQVHTQPGFANQNAIYTISASLLAGSVAATTFKVRIGNGSNNTFIINGVGGNRYYGGVGVAELSVEEVMT